MLRPAPTNIYWSIGCLNSTYLYSIQRDSSPSKDPSSSRSSYNRSISDSSHHNNRQYGGAPDPRRLSSSVDYSSHLLVGSSDRLDDSGGLYAERRESNSSRHSKSSSKRHSIAGEINHNSTNTSMSSSNSNLYHQVGSLSPKLWTKEINLLESLLTHDFISFCELVRLGGLYLESYVACWCFNDALVWKS